MWVATRDGLSRLRNGQTTIFRKGNGLPDNFVQSLYNDSRGRLWASFPAHGLSFFENGKFVGVSGLPSEEVYSITGNEKDNLWLCGTKGLSHLRGGRLVETVPWSVMGRHQQAKVIAADRGGIWLAFWIERSLLFFKDGRVQESYTSTDGRLGKGEVEVVDLRLDQDGALWVATHYSGISRMKDGHIATLTTKNGVPSDTILWSIEDNDRSVWLYTASGLVRISRSELDAWIADPSRTIQMSVWNAADGVVIRETAPSYYSPSVAKSSDGKLWFNTGDGLQLVDPRHLAFNKLPPPVHIEGIVADHKVLWQNLPGTTVSNLRLSPRTRDLALNYTALSLVTPEKVHFKYKLEGQDSDWREVINDREVQYSNLAPRHYRFRVIASNNSGVWNEQGDALEFSIAPAYYQTAWFRALCAAGIIAVFWAFYLSRVRRLHHEFEMTLDARVGERTRIARDLHDTLLQSFHGILLHLQILSNELPGDTTKARLQSIIDQAEHAIVEGRDAVKGLRTSAEERNNLALAIRTLGEELGASNSRRPDFTVQVEGAPRNLHPIVRDEVYRIAGEAMRNAFRHANAQRIEVEIHYDEGEFRVRVRDNGKGIDRKLIGEDGREGHFGLRGMRERAKLLGGKLTVWSELDSGTEVELSLAAAHAYLAALERRRSGLVEKLAGRFGRKDS
jgi:signal transduction histidine kinase